MKWMIDRIEISNLKFFYGDFPFEIKRENLLVFGENGAGKSSLFWCLHMLYHASTKCWDQATKYFLPEHPENLRNRFVCANAQSGIKVTFSDGMGASKSAEDYGDHTYISNPEMTEFLRQSFLTSDFLNAKQIYKLFDFQNSEDNEVFDHLLKEIFPLLDLPTPLKDLNGNPLNTSNIAESWKWLNSFDEYLPKNPKKKNTYVVKCEEYDNYSARLKDFNRAIVLIIKIIIARTNEIIKKDFNIPVELLFEYIPPKFNEIIPGSNKRRTGALTSPKIFLKAQFISPHLADNRPISHLRSFFNEAKISCMGIAFRFAVLEQRAPLPGSASILAVDDLLNSMDMSVRRLVIPVLLDYQKTWQLFIFTHDRSLFHILCTELNRRNEKIGLENEIRKEEELEELPEERWQVCEMYAIPDENGIPIPLLVSPKSYLGQAVSHLKNCRIPECANALRKQCEAECKRLLPSNQIYKNTLEDTDNIKIELQALFNKTKSYLVDLCKIKEVGDALIDLDCERKLLLNAFSHDDLESQFYREELNAIIDNLSLLAKVRESESFPEDGAIRKKRCRMRLSVGDGVSLKEGYVDIIFNEPLRSYKFKDNIYSNSPEVKVVGISDPGITGIKIGDAYNLRKVYNRLHNFIKPGAKRYGKEIISVIE